MLYGSFEKLQNTYLLISCALSNDSISFFKIYIIIHAEKCIFTLKINFGQFLSLN